MTTETTAAVTTSNEIPAGCACRACRVCGRPLKGRQGESGRGRKKEVHRECGIYETRMAQAKAMLEKMQFEDLAHVKKVRGDMFATVNQNLRKDVVKLAPGSTDELDISECK